MSFCNNFFFNDFKKNVGHPKDYTAAMSQNCRGTQNLWIPTSEEDDHKKRQKTWRFGVMLSVWRDRLRLWVRERRRRVVTEMIPHLIRLFYLFGSCCSHLHKSTVTRTQIYSTKVEDERITLINLARSGDLDHSVFVSLSGELFLYWLWTVHTLVSRVTLPRQPMAQQ